MKPATPLLALLLTAFPPATCVGQNKPWDLVGELVSIEDGDDKPIKLANIEVTVREYLRSGTTDDQGRFVIQLPAAAKPGQEVTLRHDKDKYEIFSPYRGALRLPAPGNPPPVIEIRMLPKGSKRWWTDAFIDAYVKYERSKSTQHLGEDERTWFDPEALLPELADYTGSPLDETRSRLTDYIRRARENAGNIQQKANAEFIAGNLSLAKELLRKESENLEGGGLDQMRLAAYVLESAGDVSYTNLDSIEALSTYQAVVKRLGLYKDNRKELGLGDYPESASDLRRLAFKIALTQVDVGVRLADRKQLREAIGAYRRLLDEQPPSTNPKHWALIQDCLGNALSELADQTDGHAATELLEQARAAYDLALTVRTRKDWPRDWAATQSDRAATLRQLAERTEGRRANELLEQAVAAYRLALEVHNPKQWPQDWARTQNNLSAALKVLAQLTKDPRSTELLEQAVAACRFALEVLSPQKQRLRWARIQNTLGNALSDLADREKGRVATELLEQARAAYDLALTVRTRKDWPRDWAATQNSLGVTLHRLAERSEGQQATGYLEQAIAAYRLALEVYTRESTPKVWAMAKVNLGDAFVKLADRKKGQAATELLEQARAAYDLALTVRTRKDWPRDWAATHHKRGVVLFQLVDRTEGQQAPELLKECVEAWRSSLEVYTREEWPLIWAEIHYNLGTSLGMLAGRTEGEGVGELIKQSGEAYRSALKVVTREDFPEFWASIQSNLGINLSQSARRTEGPKAVELLKESIAAHHLGLEVFTRDKHRIEWASTQHNLGNALRDLADKTEGSQVAELLKQAVASYRLGLEVRRKDYPRARDRASTRRNLGRTLERFFLHREYRPGLEQLKALEHEKDLADDPQFLSLVYLLKVLCHEALAERDRASEALDSFIAHVERQPEGFRIEWDLSLLRRVSEQSNSQTIVARRRFLLGLLDAVSKGSRDDILAGLRRLRGR
jgi:tetratricopeptide (TPR) repeat protein